MSEPGETPGHLTVPQVAERLGMTPSGVYKLVQRGNLKAIRRSARKMLVPEPALKAYVARLNGQGPVTNLSGPAVDPEAARAAFRAEHGREPYDWLNAWKAGTVPDTAENNETALRALAIVVKEETLATA